MIYTELTKKAMSIAIKAHDGQTDKGGFAYIFHPIYVAMQQESEAAVCAALLHDVAEDTEMTIEQLAAEGFGEEIIAALRLLTHAEGVPYEDYISAIAGNPIARSVKLADLRHNSDLSRIAEPTQWDISRCERYKKYISFLEGWG